MSFKTKPNVVVFIVLNRGPRGFVLQCEFLTPPPPPPPSPTPPPPTPPSPPSTLFRVKLFGETLNGYNKEIESFRKKELANAEEMQKNVDKLKDLHRLLEEAVTELEVFQREK